MTGNLSRIYQWFRTFGSSILRYRYLILILYIGLLAFGMMGLNKIIINASYDEYFPENDPFQIAKEHFEEVFGNNKDAMLLVEADDVFNPEILQMIRDLSNELLQTVPWADEVISLTEFEFTSGENDGLVIEPLVSDVIPSDQAAIEEIRSKAMSKPSFLNRLVSDDSKLTWIILRLRPFPENYTTEKHETAEYYVGGVIQDIVHSEKYSSFNIRASGMPVLTFDKTNIFKEEMQKSMMLGLLVAFIILAVYLRTLKGILIPILTMVSSIFIVYGFMGHLGIMVDSSMMTIPILLSLGLSIGYSIHVFNFYQRHFIATGKRKESVIYAVENTGWALFFTAITTIVSLLSFYTVPIKITHWLGGTGAALVLMVFLNVIVLTPILLSFGKDKKQLKVAKQRSFIRWDNYFKSFGEWVLGHGNGILIVFTIITLIFGYGLTKIEVSMNWPDSFGLKVPYVKRMWDVGHSKIGSLFNYNVTLEFEEADRVKDPELLSKYDEFCDFCGNLNKNKRISSLLDILKDMNQVVHNDEVKYYSIPESRELVSQLLFLYETSGGSQVEQWVDYDYTTLRMMVEVEEFDAKVYNENFNLIVAKANELFPDATLGFTGTAAQFAVIIHYISIGEVYSFLTAIIVITILMMFVFKSIKTGLIGMVPNIMPAIIIGGSMGFLGIPLDMMKMMIMPLLLGIAVDDTIHFINHSKYAIQNTSNYREGILDTFAMIGRALTMTTLIISLSFLIYGTSIIKAIKHIGVFLALGLFTALIADFFVTPVLLEKLKPFKNGKDS